MKKKISVALDCDDTLYECNKQALTLLNKKNKTSYQVEDIHSWGVLGNELDERLAYFEDPEFYQTQPVMEGAQEFVRELSKIAEVFIATSTPPQCMGQRISRVVKDFPEIPVENIFMGSKKNLLHVDVLLDDGLHNIRESNADYPVLFRQPWNQSASGILSVNTYKEFLTLIKTIKNAGDPNIGPAKLLCLVGPSGSGKKDIINALTDRHFVSKVRTWTTRESWTNPETIQGYAANSYRYLEEEDFAKEVFFEQTVYGGYRFGTKLEDIEKAMCFHPAVMALDICGCMAMRHLYEDKCRLVFIRRSKEDMISDILERKISNEEKKKRILSLDVELKNADLCDYVVDYNGFPEEAADEIAKAFSLK